jgi:hypothetical protein
MNRLDCFVNDQVIAVDNLIPTRTQDGLKHDRLNIQLYIRNSHPGPLQRGIIDLNRRDEARDYIYGCCDCFSLQRGSGNHAASHV